MAIEIKNSCDGWYDVTSPRGQAVVLQVLLRMKLGAALLAAPVCSSWIWINRNTAARSPFAPLGNEFLAHVAAGNLQVAFLVLVILACHSKGILWIIKQPQGS
eukprot:15435312-Alexandrium_andersonii.AAC.1